LVQIRFGGYTCLTLAFQVLLVAKALSDESR
jgi:hypothetical protein